MIRKREEKHKWHAEYQKVNNKKCKEVQCIDGHDPNLEDPPHIDANFMKCLKRDEKLPIILVVENEQIKVVSNDTTRKVSIGAGLESVSKLNIQNCCGITWMCSHRVQMTCLV